MQFFTCLQEYLEFQSLFWLSCAKKSHLSLQVLSLKFALNCLKIKLILLHSFLSCPPSPFFLAVFGFGRWAGMKCFYKLYSFPVFCNMLEILRVNFVVLLFLRIPYFLLLGSAGAWWEPFLILRGIVHPESSSLLENQSTSIEGFIKRRKRACNY